MKSSNQEECVLCCREIAIYATGVCDHAVCYECSARMRVLCETNECPICRGEMPLVVFTHKACTFSDVSKQFSLFNRKYQIYFEDENIMREFQLLLISKCHICEEVFPTFEKLKEHVRRKHELHYCDICTNSLKIFTFERKCYNRQELARHKRKGDPDLTSHRGHPLCEFCDMRYVDYDDLFSHVRREHYFCHFCDADGLNQYYGSYDYLKVHFRTDHYLCEEGDCANEKFTAAFRTEIDLKAHKATQHSKNKTKAEARQARTLEFEFNYVPHTRPTGNASPRGRRYVQQRRNNNIEEPSSNDRSQNKNQPEAEPLDTQSTQEFPYLSEESPSSSTSVGKPPVESTLSLQSFGRTVPPPRRSNMMSVEDFPALGSATLSASTDVPSSQTKKIDFSTIKQDNASGALTQVSRKNNSARGLNTSEESKPENKSNGRQVTPKWLFKKDNTNFEEDFPKLETKNAPPVTTASVDTKRSSVQNYTSTVRAAPHNSVSDSLQNSGDQFVVIKSKSKKKKQKAPVTDEEDEDFCQPKVSDPISSFGSYSNLNNQENRDPFRPRVPARPPKMSDTWETEVSFRTDDFPPLEVMKKPPPPPGLSTKKSRAPPPGFTTNSNISSNSSSLSMSSIARIVENSLKNNLNSEKNNGVYDPPQNNHVYQEPPNCQSRNEKLIETINSASQTPEKFQEFKTVSRSFRCGTLVASDYYSKCLEILGDEGFHDIFPELVALLPDIPKQQELLAVHIRYLNKLNSTSKRKNNFKDKNSVLSCKSCSQVLLVDDCESHNCVS